MNKKMKKEPIIKNDRVKDRIIKLMKNHIPNMLVDSMSLGIPIRKKETQDTILGGAAHGANSALFGLPSKIKPVKNYLEEFEKSHPDATKYGKFAGETAGWMLPGNVIKGALKGVKGVKALPKIVNFLDKGKLKNIIADDLFHAAAYSGAKAVGEGEGLADSFRDLRTT